MHLKDYQKNAAETDQNKNRGGDGRLIPLLGIAGEVGHLLQEYKKHLRDGDAHRLFKDHIAEKLGDILWYLANLAEKFDLDLEEVAQKNLAKTKSRWIAITESSLGGQKFFDADFPASEQLPRSFAVTFEEEQLNGNPVIRLSVDGKQVGDELTDNAHDKDGYRFHDVFHLANVAILGWSPVVRKLLSCKRKSVEKIDEVEDGGRAAVIEEGLVASVFAYAAKHDFLNNIRHVDLDLLRSIKDLTAHLEVKSASYSQWENAILQGYAAFRELVANRGGTVRVDMTAKLITYEAPKRGGS